MEIRDRSTADYRWHSLDPIFIIGRQRTGTSIIWRALQVAGFLGFPEGHLWFDLVESFARFRNPEYQAEVRQDIFTLGSARNLVLEKRFALMMDQFHRDLLPPELVRWVDKSPGTRPALLAPMLAEIFPAAQFIFLCRNPITTVNSVVHSVSNNAAPNSEATSKGDSSLHDYRLASRYWAQVMEIWRHVRSLLDNRYIEVVQERIVRSPVSVANRLAEFLHIPQFAEDIAAVFRARRENTAFPDREVDDFFYAVDWTDEQKAAVAEECRQEMAFWGYELDFNHPGGPDPTKVRRSESDVTDLESYYRLLQRYDQLDIAKEHIARVGQGRVMRVLNGVERILRRLGLRR